MPNPTVDVEKVTGKEFHKIARQSTADAGAEAQITSPVARSRKPPESFTRLRQQKFGALLYKSGVGANNSV